MKAGTGDYVYEAGAHKPEYETMAMFGSNCCNDNLDSLIVASDICNRLGMDTISAGACVAFTLECFENGIVGTGETGGLDMRWGDHRAIIALTEMIGRREGFGDVLADGVKIAAERIGQGSERYAMHIGGQEIAAHDPRGGWGFATGYGADPTPGRHNQGGGQHPPGLDIPEVTREQRVGRGLNHKISTNYMHAISAMGMCQFVIGSYPHADQLVEALKAIAGWEDVTSEEVLSDGRTDHQRPPGFQPPGGPQGSLRVPGEDAGRPPQAGRSSRRHHLHASRSLRRVPRVDGLGRRNR